MEGNHREQAQLGLLHSERAAPVRPRSNEGQNEQYQDDPTQRAM